ncbi:monocarboxylate transporter 13-like [Scylla paramamosain]|uniref:monocarboxylate transporter 13-like n=1 Tax=Scylla paramamosain TaxID=85552 RepID=UPI003082C20A
MPALTEADPVTSLQVDEKLKRSEHHNSSDSDMSESECIVGKEGGGGGSKGENSKESEEGGVLAVPSPPAPADRATPSPAEESGGSLKRGSYEVTIEKKKAVLNHVNEDGQGLEETSNGLKSPKHRDKSEEGGEVKMEVNEHDDLDRGWAFLVVLGTFTTMVAVAIVGPCFGILFADFLIERNATSTTTGAIFNTENFAWSVSNLLAGPLTEVFGWRAVGIAAGLMCSAGMAASAFAPSVSFLFFSYSVLSGFGSGSACLVSFAVIPRFFKRMLGRANGLTTAGLCIGGIIGPPIITYLQELCGFRGATLIVAVFALSISLAATIFRPVRKNGLEVSKVKEGAVPRPGPCKLIGQMVCSVGRNCLLLRLPRVAIIAIGGSFVVGIFLNLSLLMPFAMEAKGHTVETAAWCMSITNLCNLTSRILISSFSDMAWFNVLVAYIVMSFFLTISTLAFGFLQELVWIMVALAVCGFSTGSCMFLYNMIMMKYMGLHLYVPVMGVSGLINGLWMICSGPLIGLVRDWSGSYVVSVCVLGSTGFLATALFLLMPIAVAYEKRREEQLRTKDAEVGG